MHYYLSGFRRERAAAERRVKNGFPFSPSFLVGEVQDCATE